MVDWWGNVELSYKFAIVLGGAIVVVFIAGFLKLWYITRRTAKLQLKEDTERANKTTEKAGIQKVLGPGDLFGVRAIEKGFYGGVSQVDLTAPATRKVSPPPSPTATTLLDSRRNTGASSVMSSFNQPYGAPSGQSTPAIPGTPNMHNPTIRIQPSGVQSYSNYSALDTSSPMPSPAASDRFPFPSVQDASSGEADDSDYLSRPGRAYDPQPTARRDAYKKKPPPIAVHKSRGNTDGPLISPNGSPFLVSGPPTPRSVRAPPHSNNGGLRSPTFSAFPSTQTSRRAPPRPDMGRSMSDESIRSRSNTPDAQNAKSSRVNSESPSVQLRVLSGYSNWTDDIVDDYLGATQSKQLNTSAPQSSKQPRSSRAMSKQPTGMGPFQSIEESDESTPSVSPERQTRQSRKASTDRNSRSRSTSIGRTILRTQDSVRLANHKREKSASSIAERKRDVLHYDPAGERTRAGSIPGRAMDFDAPRNSPFADVYQAHSMKASIDSTTTTESRYTDESAGAESEIDDEELERQNAQKISQWKARELQKAIEAATASGRLPVTRPISGADYSLMGGQSVGANDSYEKYQARLKASRAGPARSVEPTRGAKSPIADLDLTIPEQNKELKMMASPMELVRKWQQEEAARGREGGEASVSAGPEMR